MRTWMGVVAWLAVGCGGVQSICATSETQEALPRINDVISLAVDYWVDQGRSDIVAVDGDNCDIPVEPGSLNRPGYRVYARARVVPLLTGGCTAQHIRVNLDEWYRVEERDAEVRVIAHEIGHLYCLEDAESGVMSTDWEYGPLEGYQVD